MSILNKVFRNFSFKRKAVSSKAVIAVSGVDAMSITLFCGLVRLRLHVKVH